jgi:hypothetical protein
MKKKMIQELNAKVVQERKEAKAKAKEDAKAERILKKAAMKEEKIKTHNDSKEAIQDLFKRIRSDIINPVGTKKALFMRAKGDKGLGKMITMQDVNEWWDTQSVGQIKKKTGFNSFVASLPREQFHLDIAYITKAKKKSELTSKAGFLPEEEGRDDVDPVDPEKKPAKGLKNIPQIYGEFAKAFIAVDVFSRKVSVTPVYGTTSEDAVKGMKKAVQDLGMPKTVYTDDGGEFKDQFAKYLKEQNIEHIVTRKHAMLAERFTRFLRWHLRDRQERFGGDWGVYAKQIVDQTTKAPKHSQHTQQPS